MGTGGGWSNPLTRPTDHPLKGTRETSGLLGAGSDDSRSPTGDGAVMSHSTPLEPRSPRCSSSSPRWDAGVDLSAGVPLSFIPSSVQSLHSTLLPLIFKVPGEGEHLSPPEPVGGPYPGPWGGAPDVYPESIAQSHKELADAWELGLQGHFAAPADLASKTASQDLEQQDLAKDFEIRGGTQLTLICPSWGMVGHCQHDHYFAKELICNREWCANCGGDGGKAHLRRTADKLPKARQLETMGKFTIPVPPELRHIYRDPKALSALGVSFKRMLQYHGFDRGIRRFHFFGEDHPGSGLQGEGRPIYHPHLEAIVEHGYLAPRKLYQVKRSVAHILGVSLERVVVHYQYGSEVGKKLHMLRYMLRPTFEKYEWDPQLAHALVGFRNALSWGQWHQKVWNRVKGKMVNGDYLSPVWDIPEGSTKMSQTPEALQHGACPVDGSQITWGETMEAKSLVSPYWSEIGGGYWAWTGLVRDGPILPVRDSLANAPEKRVRSLTFSTDSLSQAGDRGSPAADIRNGG